MSRPVSLQSDTRVIVAMVALLPMLYCARGWSIPGTPLR
jgi:hypothetical protein